MSVKTFKAAIDNLGDECVTIGGGEPTLHPHFEELLLYAMAKCESVGVITNGGITKRAIMLAELGYKFKDRLWVALSQDEYHDAIDYSVIDIFQRYKLEMRRSHNLVDSGRCDFGNTDDCICADRFVTPAGNIKVCGCLDSPIIGNVSKGIVNNKYDEYDCIKQYRKEHSKVLQSQY
jgi:MoaA/NifB/PqqE/SkfB family radical SAM enzyme